LVGRILASPAGDILDDQEMRSLGVFCVHEPQAAPRTVLCLDRRNLDAMRREVGLGPLLASLKGLDLHYLVVQDEHGVLAASPNPGKVSGFVEDPTLAQVQAGADGAVQARLLEGDAPPVFEVVAPLALADGSRAVVRTALDAGELTRLRGMIDRRMTAMAGGLGVAVLLSVALAWVLSRGVQRREEFAEQIRRQEQETRHWQSVGQMSATVAHEVRNPLNTISMALQRMDREVRAAPGDVPAFRELLHLATDATDRVEHVVRDFLELGRPLELDVQPHSLEVLLREVVAPLQLRAQAGDVTLTVSCPGGVEVQVDRLRFEQAVANLITNALDASPAGTTVTLRGGRDVSGVWVAVQDQGSGMDADTLARVQEPFFTTRATGTGLGLPMARRVTEAHGGRLTLMSAPGQGTIATVVLPDANGWAVAGRATGGA
jgi:signal transduction histidine kinase